MKPTMLAKFEENSWNHYEVTGDGFLAFSALFAGALVQVNVFHRTNYDRGIPYYEIRLSDKGRVLMKAWKEGDPEALSGASA